MDAQHLVDPAIKTGPLDAARKLGNLLAQTAEYQEFIAALKAVNSNLIVQKLATEMRAHQTALHWGQDSEGQHAAELTRLELEMENQPVFQEYQQKERELKLLFQTVDQMISQEAGVDFAVNAQRSGCGCGS